MTREQIIDPATSATDRGREQECLRSIFCSVLQDYGGMCCTPLEYDEPDPAPDFDDDENDDDEYGPTDESVKSILAAGALTEHARQHAG